MHSTVFENSLTDETETKDFEGDFEGENFKNKLVALSKEWFWTIIKETSTRALTVLNKTCYLQEVPLEICMYNVHYGMSLLWSISVLHNNHVGINSISLLYSYV